MIRVLHVIDKLSMDGQNPSSVTHLLGDWIPRLAELGIHSEVCTLRDPEPAAGYLEDRDIVVHRLGHGTFSPRNLIAVAHLAREREARILHLHGFASTDFGRVVSKRLHIPNIVHEHATLNIPFHQKVADRILGRWTDAAVAVSESVQEFMRGERAIPNDRIEVIGNGVDLQRFKPGDPEHVARLRRDLGIPIEAPVVGMVGRLREEKGPEFLVRAFPRVLEEVPAARLLIAGEGPERESLKRLIEGTQIADRVLMLGFRSDIPDLLGALDVLVIPSLTEGFPLTLVEGMASARPIVATRVGGMAVIAKDGETALLVPPRDPEALATRTIEILRAPDLAARLATSAREAVHVHSADASAKKVADLYRRMAPEGARPAPS